MGTFLLFL